MRIREIAMTDETLDAAAIPGLFPALELDGNLHADGGAV
jgi:predicted acylesterase/phospholipase RssA